ncbi:hypothetical protein B0H14DRAFT_2565405 [Mycena olivaceomarginata]|nr:hypothetical protein B0H14DRAFT_2565405 [Mycena olivaceomarginata]
MGGDVLSHVRILTSQRGGSRSTEHAPHSRVQGLVDEWSGEIATLDDSITVQNVQSATAIIVLGQDKIRIRHALTHNQIPVMERRDGELERFKQIERGGKSLASRTAAVCAGERLNDLAVQTGTSTAFKTMSKGTKRLGEHWSPRLGLTLESDLAQTWAPVIFIQTYRKLGKEVFFLMWSSRISCASGCRHFSRPMGAGLSTVMPVPPTPLRFITTMHARSSSRGSAGQQRRGAGDARAGGDAAAALPGGQGPDQCGYEEGVHAVGVEIRVAS